MKQKKKRRGDDPFVNGPHKRDWSVKNKTVSDFFAESKQTVTASVKKKQKQTEELHGQ